MDELVDLEDDLGTKKETSIEEAITNKVDNNLGGSSSKALPTSRSSLTLVLVIRFDSWDNTIIMSWCQRLQTMNLDRILLKPVFLSPIRISFQTTLILKVTVRFLNQKMHSRILTLTDSSLLSTFSWMCVSASSFLGQGISVNMDTFWVWKFA